MSDAEDPGTSGAAPPPNDEGSNARSRLLELAKRKRQEQEEAENAAAAKKGHSVAIDFGDSEDEEDVAGLPEPQKEQVNIADLFGDDEDEQELAAPTEADRAFIDDTGVAEDQQIDFGDDDEQQFNKDDEAVESDLEDELDKLFTKRKRRESNTDYENKALVDSFLAQMEVAVEEDMKDYEQGRPATHKLRMLSRVQDLLSTQKLHNELLDGGLLGVLKAWIDPMPDGTLPNTTIRSSILKLLDILPVDCAMEDRKAQLKRSGLGRSIMFLAKVSDETAANKRLARGLVEKWSRPILVSRSTRGADTAEEQQILQSRQLRLAAKKPQADKELDQNGRPVKLRPGDPGFRRHAAIPEAASLDYVKRPESMTVLPVGRNAGREKPSEHKLSKKLKVMGKKNQFGRAANVSVEGRNVTIQH
ncbi:hypothetical protein ACKKBF_B01830 [Auxenochlorella protothecoides x Auxenochlorella symbiontica]